MSYSLRLKEGDVVLKGNSFDYVTGLDKLTQDLTIWLKERYGSDRFHTDYGSVLDSYIGDVIDNTSVYEVESEINRVLLNYQALQRRRFKDDPQSLMPSEILAEVSSVRAELNYDRIEARVDFRTYSGLSGSLNVDLELR